MSRDQERRRLAAILAADVAGYTRLIEQDTVGTVAAWKAARDDVIQPMLAGHRGRLVKLTGDGFLAEFPSVQDAVTCAVAMQESLSESILNFRMGVHLGDVMDDGADIHGEGVNIAARIEALAEPGGISITGAVYEQVRNRVATKFEDSGEHEVKHVSAPIRVYRASSGVDEAVARPAEVVSGDVEQDIRFCHSKDGVSLAYASVGEGSPLVKAPNWMNHLEYDWTSPVWGHLLRALSARHTLLRFDQRCNGLSDWQVPGITFNDMVNDMVSVVDAAGLERFSLLGISQGCRYSIAFAARYPERVSRLVLYGGSATGLNLRGPEAKQTAALQQQMMLAGWGQDNPAFRQFFTTLFIPEATKEQMDWFNELQRVTISPENAVRISEVSSNSDVSELLSSVTVPTLVLHCRNDEVTPFEEGRKLAAGIHNARFVALEGKNHLILESEAAWPRFLNEVTGFLAQDG
jgi:class 3 adenylate cyclase/pimeloyl-ACP methyl ester carboxylesterase